MKNSWSNIVFEGILATVWFVLLASALTWPMVVNPTEVIVGGGELGGWFWRQWWHFSEVQALENEDFGVWGTIEALISLGRFPETGNILDILFLSFPLREWLGVGLDHNAKIMIILLGNGLCGYVLARSFTNWILGLAAGSIAIVNPLVIQDINKLGLRQTLLWWMLLFPALLQRAARTGTIIDGVLVGVCFFSDSCILLVLWFIFSDVWCRVVGVVPLETPTHQLALHDDGFQQQVWHLSWVCSFSFYHTSLPTPMNLEKGGLRSCQK